MKKSSLVDIEYRLHGVPTRAIVMCTMFTT